MLFSKFKFNGDGQEIHMRKYLKTEDYMKTKKYNVRVRTLNFDYPFVQFHIQKNLSTDPSMNQTIEIPLIFMNSFLKMRSNQPKYERSKQFSR